MQKIISKKNRQHNGQKEKVPKYKQRYTKHTYKTKDRVKRTPLKTGVELRCNDLWLSLKKYEVLGRDEQFKPFVAATGTAYPSGAPEFTPGS